MRILQWFNIYILFFKDHVTLKNGVMAAENLALPSQQYIFKKKKFYKFYILKYIKQCYMLRYVQL